MPCIRLWEILEMIQFRINEQLPSLNDYINKLKSSNGKRMGSMFKKRIDELCEAYMLPIKTKAIEECKEPVIILFEWNEKSKRRDLDNVYSAKKYILDALQKIGILENDNYRHVKGVYDTVVYGQTDFVTVRIFPITQHNEMWERYMQCERIRIEQECEKL